MVGVVVVAMIIIVNIIIIIFVIVNGIDKDFATFTTDGQFIPERIDGERAHFFALRQV